MTNQSLLTTIGPETTIRGELALAGPCRILGCFEGAIRGATEIHIAAGGRCAAALEADRIVIDGTHTGDIIARESLHLGPSARVQGNVVAASFAGAEGAVFAGSVGIGSAARNQAAVQSGKAGVTTLRFRPLSEPDPRVVDPRGADWVEGLAPAEGTESAGAWLTPELKEPTWLRDATGAD